ncbi:MAG: hypothetical protein P8J79_01325 [Halioglobus sp.]|nr:hypothetical protein [Halioglobus sp.]
MPFTRDIFGFTDRPNRQHTYLTAYEFTSLWSEESDDSFSADPPNAVLTWFDGEQLREVEVIVNSATVSSDGVQESVVYEVKLETDQMPDAQMSFASFFVDSSSQCVNGKNRWRGLITRAKRGKRAMRPSDSDVL